jgi:hypothetical protein
MHLDVRGLLKDVHVPTLILAPERSTAAPKEYRPLERFLIAGIPCLSIGRSRGRNSFGLMVKAMRSLSTERTNASRKSKILLPVYTRDEVSG